ncbi:MAG: hypothetical protein LBK25_02355, partial [Treponema sp.]|nr:hypothetical protein [Treponema sp.]
MRRLYFFPVMFLLVGCPLLYFDFGESFASYMVYYLVEVENNTETDIVAFQAGQFYRSKNGEIDCLIYEEPKLTIPAHSSGEFSFGWRYYSTSSPSDESFNFVLNDGSRDYLFAGWREEVYQTPNAVVYGLGYGNSSKKVCFERDGKTETYSVKGTVDVYGKLRLVFNSPDDIQCGVVGNLTTDEASIFGSQGAPPPP